MAKHRHDEPPPLPPGVPADGSPVAGDDERKKPPPFGTARPAPRGDLPRVCDPLDRAGEGEVRVKVCCRNYRPQETRYVLCEKRTPAEIEADATRCFLAKNGLDKQVEQLRKTAGAKADDVEPPAVTCKILSD
jgi:hypothetical protein